MRGSGEIRSMVVARLLIMSALLVYSWAIIEGPILAAYGALAVAATAALAASLWESSRMRQFRDTALICFPELVKAHGISSRSRLFGWGNVPGLRDLAAEPSVRESASTASLAAFVEASFRVRRWIILALCLAIAVGVGVLVGMALR